MNTVTNFATEDEANAFSAMHCATLNFDFFHRLISSIPQRILVKLSSTSSLVQSSIIDACEAMIMQSPHGKLLACFIADTAI